MSSEALKQAEQNQIKNLEAKTGKKLEEWIQIVKKSGLGKHNENISFLKEKHGMGHGNANLIVHYANQSHAGASAGDDLIEDQYKGKEALRPWYDRLVQDIASFGSDVEQAPKKGYLSLRRKKQFAIIQPSTKSRLDLGLNSKTLLASGRLEAAGSWNAMCTHRVRIEDGSAINAELIGWLRTCYDEAG